MTPIFWQEFGVLFVAALIGSGAVLPYSMRLLQGKQTKYSTRTLMLLSMLQNAVIFAVVTVLGLLASHAIGLGAPYVEAMLGGMPLPSGMGILIAIIFGIIAGALLLLADLFFVPYWPKPLLDTALKTTLFENFLASFYGGINEELLMRLFGFSALVWLLSFIWRLNPIIFWSVNVVMAIVFGIGHLPALKGVAGTISHAMFARALLLNAPVGLVCGWLFWTYGIEAAMVAHFSADIVYHVFGTIVLRSKMSFSLAESQ
jgi:hypothetical protein